MRNFLYILIFTIIPLYGTSNEIKCSDFGKMTKEYAKCIANKSKLKVDKNLEKVGIKEKISKFKNSKTLMDIFK